MIGSLASVSISGCGLPTVLSSNSRIAPMSPSFALATKTRATSRMSSFVTASIRAALSHATRRA